MKSIELRRIMNRQGLTPREFANKLGYSESLISKVLNGKQDISKRMVYIIETKLNIKCKRQI